VYVHSNKKLKLLLHHLMDHFIFMHMHAASSFIIDNVFHCRNHTHACIVCVHALTFECII